MKFLQLALLLVLLASLAACQSNPTPVVTQYPFPPTDMPQPQPNAEVYPFPRPVYLPALPYPEPGQTVADIDWALAEQVLMTGQVQQVFQTHALEVTLTLLDGRVFKTVEPAIDDVLNVIERCGEPCSSISVATE